MTIMNDGWKSNLLHQESHSFVLVWIEAKILIYSTRPGGTHISKSGRVWQWLDKKSHWADLHEELGKTLLQLGPAM